MFHFQECVFIPSLLRYWIPVTLRWPGGFPEITLAFITDDLPHLYQTVQKYINNLRTVARRRWLRPPGEISCVICQPIKSLQQIGDDKRKCSNYTYIKYAVDLQGKIVSSHEAAVFDKPRENIHLDLFVCCFSLQNQPETGWREDEKWTTADPIKAKCRSE